MHALGDICKKTNQLLESIDISKQTSDVPEKFERTLRWKFCEKILTAEHLAVYLRPFPLPSI